MPYGLAVSGNDSLRRMPESKKMPSKKQYDLVSDDGYDSRIPLHNEEAFQHGISFTAKYIGTLDVPRPSSRVEIVAAMRRIRYEFKAKAIKKKSVNLVIGTEGVKVTLKKKTSRSKTQYPWDESKLLVMHHPIYRIFYVSHDSQDLKIFSYIARDGSTNVFKCNVFKAYKKSHAMRMVRTIGQAFEVCHKLSLQQAAKEAEALGDNNSDKSDEITTTLKRKAKKKVTESQKECDQFDRVDNSGSNQTSPEDALMQAQQMLRSMGAKTPVSMGTFSPPLGSPVQLLGDGYQTSGQMPLSSHHQVQLLRQQLEQQQQQTQVAIAQVHLLKDQLAAEAAARIEAQARCHQLLLHNKDLLEHITQLVSRIQEVELKSVGSTPSQEFSTFKPPVQVPTLPDVNTPQPPPVYIPEFPDIDSSYPAYVPENGLFENRKTDVAYTDSPDSGHREMSSDSLMYNFSQADANAWHRKQQNTPANQNKNPFLMNNSSRVNNNNNVYQPNSQHRDQVKVVDGKAKVIVPCPMQDASGNRLDLNLTPKLEPPPKYSRQSPRSSATQESLKVGDNQQEASYRNSTTSENSSGSSDHVGGRDDSAMEISPLSDIELVDADPTELKELNSNSGHVTSIEKQRYLYNSIQEAELNDLTYSPSFKTGTSNNTYNSADKQHTMTLSEEELENNNMKNKSDRRSTDAGRRLDSLTLEEFEALSTS
ncbi:carboxyl-terminal PDZ ligand of neuronal nitric oxide synthase protein-like [Lingula anatina]|uniref:Carboxyl-terminal PDZ ligand of neuronal nitric oxide synthase protein-like n=1 Tax=Lingula anatina TaxID=7574 RepID=A0A2R2MQA5_LINAN|nr:carboxyl-terminal PDZ ligand of neuronal nitric oxide synthase protein-like [Lingula anatina]|eukprot:XP_023932421.1 carboxyl-terminal PDZ ligand of neuronal nitric oxide synthase protein-like [Lingula anatina]